jgi:hypothetical protein
MSERMVGEEVTLRVIGQQRLEIEVLRQQLQHAQGALRAARDHVCAPIPCERPCCRDSATNGSSSADLPVGELLRQDELE